MHTRAFEQSMSHALPLYFFTLHGYKLSTIKFKFSTCKVFTCTMQASYVYYRHIKWLAVMLGQEMLIQIRTSQH